MSRIGGIQCDQADCERIWTWPREPVREPWAHRLTPIWADVENRAAQVGWLVRGSRAYCPPHAHLIAAGELEPTP